MFKTRKIKQHKKTNVKPGYKLVTGLICTLIGVLLSYLIIYQQYFSVDARYSRDNLHFITSVLLQQDYLEYKAPPAIIQPEIICLYKLVDYTNRYAINVLSAKEGFTDPDKNALSVMVLQANDENIQTIYNSFQFTAACISMFFDKTLNDSMIEQISTEWKAYDESANKALNTMIKQATLLAVLSFGILATGISEICAFVKLQKNKQKEP